MGVGQRRYQVIKWMICQIWGHAWRYGMVRNRDTGETRPGRLCERCGECD